MKSTRILSVLLALLFWFFVTPKFTHAAQPTFGPNILVSSEFINQDSNSGPPILDVDIAGGVYVAWVAHSQGGASEVFFSKLTPTGSGFSSNKPLTGFNDQKSFPQIEEDSGIIYIAWGERRIINGVANQAIFFTKSTDGGSTFTEEVFIDGNDELPISMIAHDGKIFIVYSKATNEIWLALSSDGGSTFTKTKVSDSNSGGRQRPTVDFTGNNVYLFWLDARNGRYEVFFAKSEDGGYLFAANQSVFSHPNSAISLLGNNFGRLSTKVDGENIFLAFDFYLQTSNPFTMDYEVYFIKSTDGGSNFSTAKRLSDDPSGSKTKQQTPSLTLLPDGSPAIAWYDLRDGPDQPKIFLTFSQDQGDSFSPNIRINNTAANHVFSAPTIAADQEGKIHFVRMDAALSPVGVWYTKIDLGLEFAVSPTPFLDLPWDYQSKGLSFSDAALAINAYFDHEYPLLSSGLSEPISTFGTLSFDNEKLPQRKYSSHDGYDYGNLASANIDAPVLAAADGVATLGEINKCGPCGNYILINHGNNYQTRYFHLEDGSTIIQVGQSINVKQGQQIGKIGATGHVEPPGPLGAHIHFMVIQDKNNDGNFDDNIPDGITDPFGWQSTDPDPWPNYSFNYGGQTRTGNTSYYLWTKAIDNLSSALTSNGGFFELGKYKLNFPQGATNQNLNLEIQAEPIAKPTNLLHSIGATLSVIAKDTLGNIINTFQNPFTLTIDFSSSDISHYDQSTISIYSSQDGVNWNKENTNVDFITKTASAQLSHLTYFALMAQRIDATPATTTAILSGDERQPNWFRSNVAVELNAQDNENGLGVDYILYKTNDQDWKQYTDPITFTDEGSKSIEFYSVDKDENIEQIKSIEFNIDKTPPVADIHANPNILWSPNGEMVDIIITGWAQDESSGTIVEVQDEYNEIGTKTVNFGDTIKLEASRRENDKDGRKYKITVSDLAGNIAENTATVVVPHDQRGKKL